MGTEKVFVEGTFRKLYMDKNGEYVRYKGKKLYLHTYLNRLGK